MPNRAQMLKNMTHINITCNKNIHIKTHVLNLKIILMSSGIAVTPSVIWFFQTQIILISWFY